MDEPEKPIDNAENTAPETPAWQSPQTSVVTPDTAEPAPVPAETTTSTEQPPKKKSKKLLATVLAMLVLAGGAYGAFYYLQNSNNTAGSVATTTTITKMDIPQLTIGVVNGTISAYTPNDTDAYSQSIANQAYEGLVAYKDKTKIVPMLATGWSNPNNSTWDFDLRRNVTFHNGHTMTAADVVFSLKEAMKQGEDGTYSATIKDVKALGDYKVEIATALPDPFLLNRLTFLKVIDSREPADATDLANGTGPYQLKPNTKLTDQEVQLVAYDRYHGGHVSTRALTYKLEKDEKAAAADFKSGKINMAGEFNSEKPADLTGTPYQLERLTDSSVNFLTVNSVAPGPLQKKAVREALRDSLDVTAIIKAGDVAAEPASQLITREIPGYNPSVPVASQDITKAKSLLAQAGYTSGVALTLEVAPQESDKVLQAVVDQAKQAGITITLKKVDDFGQLIQDVMSGKSQLAFLAFSSDTLDGGDVFTQVVQQTGNFKSATLDSYLDQASTTLDPSKRLDILQKTSKYLTDEVAAIPLYSRYRIWVMDKPYVLPADTVSADPGIAFWQAYMTK